MSDVAFQVTCEIEPPTRPDLKHARHQIGVLSPVAHAFLIPDNHNGRATVSSIAVANEVQAMGGRSIACVNARDPNILGFRRDLLTAAAYGVDQFLLVHGDKPSAGDRTGELTVRTMIDEARAATDHPSFDGIAPFQLGVTAGHHRPMPSWKQTADFVFLQVSYSTDAVLRWRERNPTDKPGHAGVMVLASPTMALRLRATIPDIDIPDCRSRRGVRAGTGATRERRGRRCPPRSRQPLPRGSGAPRGTAVARLNASGDRALPEPDTA